MSKIRKTIAILLLVCFLVSLTASAVSAGKLEKLRDQKERMAPIQYKVLKHITSPVVLNLPLYFDDAALILNKFKK